MLTFKGIPFDTLYVAYHEKEDLIAATGQDYVPTLMWDDHAVMWYDIPDFLEEKVPEPTLYPEDWRGVAVALERWGHAVVEEVVWRYVVTKVPPFLRDDHERWVFEEMQVKGRGPWHILEARREEFREGMMEELRRVDAMLAGKTWILGEPSLADFGLYGSLSPLLTVGEEVPPELPNLVAWVDRIRELGS
jgi:glutathione S-transferase